jgi:RND family efflux transporter MFP subunit
VIVKIILSLLFSLNSRALYYTRTALLVVIIGASAFTDGVFVFAQERLSFSGITEPIEDVKLSMSVEGRIAAIFFKEGDHIKKGQSIIELESKLEELEVERRKLIWESKAELEAAAAKVITLKSQLDSTRKLFESTGSVSREELEEKELNYILAMAERKRLNMEEERQRIEYEMARENLRKRRLESPLKGVIIKLFLHKGESCEAEEPLVHVVDASQCRFVCNVEEKIGRTLKKGQTVDLKIRAGSASINKQGIVTFVSPVTDPASGLLEIKAEFDNQDGEIRPGVEGFMLLTPF